MRSVKKYETAEICNLFNISKSTLFRWEREGVLPPIARDENDVRQYSATTLARVYRKHVLLPKLERAKLNPQRLQMLREKLALTLFIEGDSSGLVELAQMERASAETIQVLVLVTQDLYQPKQPEFAKALKVASTLSERLQR